MAEFLESWRSLCFISDAQKFDYRKYQQICELLELGPKELKDEVNIEKLDKIVDRGFEWRWRTLVLPRVCKNGSRITP